MNAADLLLAHRLASEPWYRPVADEVALFEAAWQARMPMMLKGPTGCGKTRFVEHMAWKLGKPLVTVACNEDMTAADLVGRYLLDASGTRWQDGPLALAARHGAICYLDEVVEARQDTTVVIHPLTDTRRALPLEKKGELLHAHLAPRDRKPCRFRHHRRSGHRHNVRGAHPAGEPAIEQVGRHLRPALVGALKVEQGVHGKPADDGGLRSGPGAQAQDGGGGAVRGHGVVDDGAGS